MVVSYVNTTAAVKAESDYCVTSGNAEAVVRSIPSWQKILFLPDFFLGTWLKQTLGRENMEIWLGECHVHAGIRPDELEASRKAHSDADLLVHPECGCSSQYVYGKQAGMLAADSTYILSTEGMVTHAKRSPKELFLVATEVGILHRLEKEIPDKRFLRGRPGGGLQVHEADHAAEAAPDAAGHVPDRRGRAGAGRPRAPLDRPDAGRHRLTQSGRGLRGEGRAVTSARLLAPFSCSSVVGLVMDARIQGAGQ